MQRNTRGRVLSPPVSRRRQSSWSRGSSCNCPRRTVALELDRAPGCELAGNVLVSGDATGPARLGADADGACGLDPACGVRTQRFGPAGILIPSNSTGLKSVKRSRDLIRLMGNRRQDARCRRSARCITGSSARQPAECHSSACRVSAPWPGDASPRPAHTRRPPPPCRPPGSPSSARARSPRPRRHPARASGRRGSATRRRVR